MEEHAEVFEYEGGGHESGFTIVQNLFLTHFMPKAKGGYVKVYLAGLSRCYGKRTEQWVSAATLADELDVSLTTVRRAWAYWESVGVVKRTPRYLRNPFVQTDYRTARCDEYRYQTSNIIRFLSLEDAIPKKTENDSFRMSYSEYLKTDHWAEVRNKALAEANYRCRLCNAGGTLNVHHRTYKNLGAERSADVITLCHSCHQKFHDVLPNEAMVGGVANG